MRKWVGNKHRDVAQSISTVQPSNWTVLNIPAATYKLPRFPCVTDIICFWDGMVPVDSYMSQIDLPATFCQAADSTHWILFSQRVSVSKIRWVDHFKSFHPGNGDMGLSTGSTSQALSFKIWWSSHRYLENRWLRASPSQISKKQKGIMFPHQISIQRRLYPRFCSWRIWPPKYLDAIPCCSNPSFG